MKSKNIGLFNSLVDETKRYSFKIITRVYYNNGFIINSFIQEKNWKEVYELE